MNRKLTRLTNPKPISRTREARKSRPSARSRRRNIRTVRGARRPRAVTSRTGPREPEKRDEPPSLAAVLVTGVDRTAAATSRTGPGRRADARQSDRRRPAEGQPQPRTGPG